MPDKSFEGLALEVQDLSFSYTKNALTLDRIHVQVKSHSITAVLAPNGTGKTTLFKIILGQLTPLKGSISVHGNSLLSLKAKERAKLVAYIPQEQYHPFNYNVLDMVLMGFSARMDLFNAPSAKHKQEALALMEELEIAHLQDKGINDLSGGQRQMVLLARALVQNAPLLLLDEPTSALDLKNQAILFRKLQAQMQKKPLSVLINIHDPNLVCAYANEVYMFKESKNLYHGNVLEVMESAKLSELYGIEIVVDRIEDKPFVRVP